MTNSSQTNVLIIEDEIHFEKMLEAFFRKKDKSHRLNITSAIDGVEGIKRAKDQQSEIIFIDMDIPKKNGFRVIEELTPEPYISKIIPYTGKFEPRELVELENTNPKIEKCLFKSRNSLDEYLDLIIQKEEVIKVFNYGILDQNIAQLINDRTTRIKQLYKTSLRDIIEIGIYLHEVKNYLEHGYFQNWLDSELPMISSPLARKFMQVADEFQQLAEEFQNVDLKNLPIRPSAAYALVQKKNPKEMKQEIINRAKAGETITTKTIKEVQEKYKRATKPQLKKIEQIEEAQWWKLGKHYLYYGYYNHKDFAKYLPKIINLLISFPRKKEQWLKKIPTEVKQVYTFYSEYIQNYQELEQDWKSQIIYLMESMTNEQEIIVFAFLNDPLFLLAADEIDCIAFVAEPDWENCQNIIKAWNQNRTEPAINLKT